MPNDRTFIPKKSKKVLDALRKEDIRFELVRESDLLDYALEDYAKLKGINLKKSQQSENVDSAVSLRLVESPNELPFNSRFLKVFEPEKNDYNDLTSARKKVMI